MKQALLFPLILSFLSPIAHAERNLVLFGAGGEPKDKTTTIFDNTLDALDNYLANNKWNNQISFNGGHTQTEAKMVAKFPDAKTKSPFTLNNYNTIIKNYEKQIRSGEIKPGDQLMIMIDTHGAAKSDNDNSLTHQIAVGQAPASTDLSSLSGTDTFSLDTLKNLADLAKEKGIKLAILDFSCHSGNTLPLANENTCVITSTGTKHFGYSSFSDNFIKQMKSGKTLEDVFRQTRLATTDNSFPMISSEEGKAINNDFYPEITPYLYYYESNPNEDKMTDYLLKSSTNAGVCQRANQFDKLLAQLDSLKAINSINAGNSMPEIDRIKTLVEEYKTNQDRFINLLRSWGTTELNRKEQFKGKATYKKSKNDKRERTEEMTGNYTWKELIEADFDTVIKNVSSAKQGTRDPQSQAMFQASIEMHTLARQRQQEILAQYPNLKDYKQKFHAALENMQATYFVANKIALEERKLYDKMYGQLQNEKRSSNACRNFTL